VRLSDSSIQFSKQTRRRQIVRLIAQRMGFTHAARKLCVVVPQFRDHIERSHVLRIIVQDTLNPGDVTDRSKGRAADLSRALGQRIGHRENLFALIVEQQMIVPEMPAGHVPVKILGFQIQRKHIRE
jgi:hypothetical protein